MSAPLVDRVRSRLASGMVGDVESATQRESALITDSVSLREITRELDAELVGAGPLEGLLSLSGITDVLVNGPDDVWIDRGRGLERSSVTFEHDAAIRRLAVRLAAQAGRRLDDSMPYVDASLADGTRLHAILPPLVKHPMVSLRVLQRQRFALADLVARGAMSSSVAHLLRAVVDARLAVLVSGGTGTGKTTLLASLLGCVPPHERIVTVEDAPELAIDHPHVVGLVTRAANLEQAGQVSLADLVRQALRMRPDRIVVGEFRGAEVLEMLTALNTGHSGGMATVHANSARDAPSRLVALGALGGVSPDVMLALAASALEVVVHLGRARDGRRQVEEIAVWQRHDRHAVPEIAWTRDCGRGPGAAALDSLVAAAVDARPG